MRKGSAAPRKKANREPSIISQETLAALQEEIDYLWGLYRIDPYYRRAYMDSLSRLQVQMYIQLLAKEIENLYNEKAAVQQLCLAIQKREEQIKYIRQLDRFLGEGQSKSPTEARENVASLLAILWVGKEGSGGTSGGYASGRGIRSGVQRATDDGILPRRTGGEAPRGRAAPNILQRRELPDKGLQRHRVPRGLRICQTVQHIEEERPVPGGCRRALSRGPRRLQVSGPSLDGWIGGGNLRR